MLYLLKVVLCLLFICLCCADFTAISLVGASICVVVKESQSFLERKINKMFHGFIPIYGTLGDLEGN